MIRSLQVFRAVAAMLVVVQHLNIALINYFNGRVTNETLMPLGYAGVQFFFVLSGFIIYHAHRGEILDRSRLPRYLGKRACRVLPLYWLVTLALVPAWFLAPSFGEEYHRSFPALVSSLLLIPQPHDPHLTVGWTLIHEGFFYVFFSLFFLTRYFSLITSAWAAAIFVHYLLPGGGWLLDFILSPHNLLFIAGIVIAAGREWIAAHLRGGVLFALGIIFAGFGLGTALFQLYEIYPTLLFGTAALLLVMASAAGDIEPIFAKQRLLIFLGAASYAIYLIHFPLVIAFSKVLAVVDRSINLPIPLVIILLFGSALGAGVMLHLFVEKPLLAASARLFRRPSILEVTGTVTNA
jgi:peptidoglycan/LPS O-acetylase OafA/YrhL